IRVRPGTPAAAKVLALEAHGGAELLRQVLQEQKLIDGTYNVVKPEKPLEFIGQVSSTLLTGKLGRTPMGLALEITDWQELEGATRSRRTGCGSASRSCTWSRSGTATSRASR